MRVFAIPVVIASVGLAVPAVAQTAAAQEQASSGGMFDWVAGMFGGSESADQTLDAKKKPAQESGGQTANGDPTPMQVPDDAKASDQDSYMPDAGDAPQ